MCRSPLQRSLQEIEKLAKQQAGCDFSLSSAQDVANVLFNVLKLPVPPNAKPLRGGKLFSTSAEVCCLETSVLNLAGKQAVILDQADKQAGSHLLTQSVRQANRPHCDQSDGQTAT